MINLVTNIRSTKFKKVLYSPLSIAPMIDWTYSHFRVFMRMLAPSALLYTDMLTTDALINRPSLLNFHQMENPLALQLGGADKDKLVVCAKMAEQRGFDEVNLNLGCPSDRVLAGKMGACLMDEPKLVAECISLIKRSVKIPVTAKTRIGIDDKDSYEFFSSFAHRLVDAGCDKLIVHARKAWLKGLSPKQNRTIPPVNYDYVYKIKQELAEIPVVINGNISNFSEIKVHLQQVDGVMLGRLACQNPYAIAEIHHNLYPEIPLKSRAEILKNYVLYAEDEYEKGVPLSILLKPILNIAHGLPGTKAFKNNLVNIQQKKNKDAFKQVDSICDGLT